MLKEDLIRIISREAKLKRKKSLKVFDRVFELISKDLKKMGLVSIENFGEFRIERQKMKISEGKKNSVTVIPPKNIIDFKIFEK